MMLAMEREERVATPEEVRDALKANWKRWQRRLFKFAMYLTRGDHAWSRELVELAVESVLRVEGRKWPIERVPSLLDVLVLAVKSFWLNAYTKAGIPIDDEAQADEALDWTFGVENMNAAAIREEQVAAVLARGRELLEGDASGLACLAVLEDGERDEAVLEREARRTGRHVNDVKEHARRRMGRALERAYAEVVKS